MSSLRVKFFRDVAKNENLQHHVFEFHIMRLHRNRPDLTKIGAAEGLKRGSVLAPYSLDVDHALWQLIDRINIKGVVLQHFNQFNQLFFFFFLTEGFDKACFIPPHIISRCRGDLRRGSFLRVGDVFCVVCLVFRGAGYFIR